MRKNNVEDLNQKDKYGQKYFRIWMKSGDLTKNKKIIANNRKDAERQQRERQRTLEMTITSKPGMTKNCVFIGDILTKHFLLISPTKRGDYRAIFKYWKQKMSEIKIVDFSPVTLSDLQDEMKMEINEGVWKESTYNKYISFLRQALKKAYLDWHYFSTDFSVYLKHLTIASGRDRILTEEEKERLFEAARNSKREYFVDLLLVLFETGLRKMEALSLKGDNCDFENQEILIKKSKNGKPRKVPMSKKAEEVLKRRKEKNGEGYIFDKLHRGTSVSMHMKEICELAEVDDFVLHDIRHNYASKMRRNGVSTEALQRILGHKSYQSLNRYLHFEDAYEHEKVKGILNK